MQEQMNKLQSQLARAMDIPEPKEIKIQGLTASHSVVDEVDLTYPEWLPETADLEWDELTDEQRTWFENYRAYMDEAHKDLAVRPKDTKGLSERMALALAETEKEAAEKLKTKDEFMRYDSHGSKGAGVYCTCGMSKIHNRGKVLARWADKHFEKFGHYWLRS